MSEQSGGPGFWQAQDGLWYPPDTHPDPNWRAQHAGGDAVAPAGAAAGADAVAPAAAGAVADAGGGYPARLTVSDDNKIANWRALVHGFMVIPQLMVMNVLGAVAQVVGLISWFVILFTGKMPAGLHGFQSMYLRYTNRTVGFMLLLTEEYPPFEFDATAHDQSGHPIRSDFDHEADGRNRLTVFFRLFMAIPHMIVLSIVMIGASLAYIVGWFAVLFTGKMPGGIRDFLIGTGRWTTRVSAYFWLLTDRYPPFSLD